jgi:hypothetical protein
MSLLGILFGIIMLFLVGKALLETIWGLVIIGFGILCHIASWMLSGFAMLLRMFARLNKAADW